MIELPVFLGIRSADALGTFGLLLCTGAYLALQLGLIGGEGYLFPTLNLIGGSAILLSLLEMYNRYAALGEVAWIVISAIGITRLYLVRRYFRLTPEEAQAALALAPSLGKEDARILLRAGRWIDLEAGAQLAEEGRPVAALWYIAQGRCQVVHQGVPVAAIGPGGLVGEMTYRGGSAATATVVAEAPTRALRLDVADLQPLIRRKPAIGHALELGVAGDLRRKLAETTRGLTSDRPGRFG